MSEIKKKSEIPYTDGWKRGAYAYANGNYTASATAYVCSEKIPCEHNANYNFVCTLPDGSKDHGFLFWDKNGVFLGEIHNTAGVQTSPVSFTVETPTNCAVLAINISTLTGYGNRYTEDVLSFDLYSWQTLPAHQKTSTGWKDIPTHHYTNGRWQGELTSQSPLKFRADGEMLDWRVEGKTSGNLWDGTLVSTTTMGVTFKLDNDGYMYASPTNSDTRGWTYAYSQIKVTLPSGNYALCLSGTPSTSVNSGIRVNDDANTKLGYKSAINGQSTVIINFAVTDNHNIGIVAKIHDGRFRVQLLEGTYTTSTIPPYEPYGGVGDWDETTQRYKIPVTVNGVTINIYTDHQLMDGDSIDFATDQTVLSLATGNNILTVDTAVQPSKVFVKFEG